MPTAAGSVRREHVEAFIADQLTRWTPSTAASRYRYLQQFFRWLDEEGEIPASPMARMKPPAVPDAPVPVLSDDELRRLLAACDGRGYEERRDAAIIRLFVDTGTRLAELTGLRTDEVDFATGVVLVVGKGRRPRACPFGPKTAQALDRYLRVRARHPLADERWLWLGSKGRFTDSGVAQMLRRRSRKAGIPDIHPHQLRHTFAHTWLAQGGNEGDLMRLAGWRSRQMLQTLRRLSSRRTRPRGAPPAVARRAILSTNLFPRPRRGEVWMMPTDGEKPHVVISNNRANDAVTYPSVDVIWMGTNLTRARLAEHVLLSVPDHPLVGFVDCMTLRLASKGSSGPRGRRPYCRYDEPSEDGVKGALGFQSCTPAESDAPAPKTAPAPAEATADSATAARTSTRSRSRQDLLAPPIIPTFPRCPWKRRATGGINTHPQRDGRSGVEATAQPLQAPASAYRAVGSIPGGAPVGSVPPLAPVGSVPAAAAVG